MKGCGGVFSDAGIVLEIGMAGSRHTHAFVEPILERLSSLFNFTMDT